MKVRKIGVLLVACLTMLVGACASSDHADLRQHQKSEPLVVGDKAATKCGFVTLSDGSRQEVCGEAWLHATKTVTPEFGIDNNVPATVAVDRNEMIVQRDQTGAPKVVFQQTFGAVETNGPANAAIMGRVGAEGVKGVFNLGTAGLAGYFLTKIGDNDDDGGGAFAIANPVVGVSAGASASADVKEIKEKHKKH